MALPRYERFELRRTMNPTNAIPASIIDHSEGSGTGDTWPGVVGAVAWKSGFMRALSIGDLDIELLLESGLV